MASLKLHFINLQDDCVRGLKHDTLQAKTYSIKWTSAQHRDRGQKREMFRTVLRKNPANEDLD